ncbi:hypothetical protein GCM10027411_09030 [Microbacterium aureliae]
MEFQRSRFAARESATGDPVLLGDQDRSRWDRGQIARAVILLDRADAAAAARGRSRGPYALQAAIARCHAVAPRIEDTDWERIVLLYEVLGRVAPNPVVDLNHAVAVSMARGPADALALVDRLADAGVLAGSPLLRGVRGELLARLGRREEAAAELRRASALVGNAARKATLDRRVAELTERNASP